MLSLPMKQNNRNLWSMINMLKLNKKMVQNRNYYHTCPACRINIFNADFRIFLYNQAGNKTDEFFFFLLSFFPFLDWMSRLSPVTFFSKQAIYEEFAYIVLFFIILSFFFSSKWVNCAWDGAVCVLSPPKQAVCYRWLVHCPFLSLFS